MSLCMQLSVAEGPCDETVCTTQRFSFLTSFNLLYIIAPYKSWALYRCLLLDLCYIYVFLSRDGTAPICNSLYPEKISWHGPGPPPWRLLLFHSVRQMKLVMVILLIFWQKNRISLRGHCLQFKILGQVSKLFALWRTGGTFQRLKSVAPYLNISWMKGLLNTGN